NGWKAVLVDEGTIHSAHYVLVHVNHPPRREDVEAFCRLVPMPDLVVHVVAPLETVLARTFARSDPPLRRRSKEEMERFIRHAYTMFDLLMSQDTLSRKTLRVECDDDGGRLFDLHVYYRLITGGTIKGYHLPVEEMLLRGAQPTEAGVYVPEPAAELVLFVIRKSLDYAVAIEALIPREWKAAADEL